MAEKKLTFALFFGNRGFFPASLQTQARKELPAVLKKLGHKTIMLPAGATNAGAVETAAEGRLFADMLAENAGKIDGVILCLPNFGDENGAAAALRDANVPILIQAYPDDPTKMGPAHRRDSFCGKISIMDVFTQCGIKFTALPPHTVDPTSKQFAEQVEHFAAVCRVVKGVKRMTVGAIGARTTAFKTVRIDELTLQKYGVTVETFDLTNLIMQMDAADSRKVSAAKRKLAAVSDWSAAPDEVADKLARLSVALETMVTENNLDAVGIRCWTELQEMLGFSPCVVMGALTDTGVPAACEVDIGNAVTMYALQLATGSAPGLLDWNNNYGDDPDKCILFHCGQLPPSMMVGKGKIADQAIIATSIGEGKSFGCNVGRIRPGKFTFGSMNTFDGKAGFYLGTGEFTKDKIPADFFGCAGVAKIDRLQNVLQFIGRHGHRHHVSTAMGTAAAPMAEALGYYLGYEVAQPQKCC